MNAVRFVNARGVALTASLLAIAATTPAQVPLADQPVFSSVNVPGNMALALSVEFPTAISVAHSDSPFTNPRVSYASTNNYLGYFDPGKCYRYQWVSDKPNTTYQYIAGTSDDNYFYPTGPAKDRKCSGEWSGNFLNWASMQTIDPFRWALTGGYRWIDTPELTVLEKAWSSGQGSASSNFPNSTTTNSTVIAGATPFTGAATLGTAIWSYGNKMRFMAVANGSPNYTGTPVHFSGTATLATQYEVFIRVKVCDDKVGRESNCVAYQGGNYKPEGLMQQYASKIRYSAFGYLASDDSGDANLKRDGAVLRASQRFIGPTQPVPGSPDITNPLAPEWSSTTGVMFRNPSGADATASSTKTVQILDSGVMNYLNKFGEINRSVYKRYDNVSELYYAALRYFRNLGNVTEWSSLSAVTDDATRRTMLDGFPIITDWKDPIQYSCQRNFILGIGDVNTHADRNLPGATTGSKEPAMPGTVFSDKINAVEWTNKVGTLQGLANLGTSLITSNDAGYLMAGLAYYANTTDIRDDLSDTQTIKTYWLDVLEGGYKANRQFYLAAKYGGFNPPETFKVATATAKQFADNKGWWSTTTDKIGGQDRPDNYYTADKPDQMVNGLNAAFSSIASKLSAYSTSFVTSVPQISSNGTSTYATKFDAKTWTGDVVASLATVDVETGKPILQERWSFSSVLATQAAGTGWDARRNIVTYNTGTKVGVPFRSDKISEAQLNSLDTSYVTGDDKSNYLNYLRGDRTNERSSTVKDSTAAYRDRASLVGDVVNAKARPVGPPAAPYSAVTNPGYDTFKTDYASRTPMVYAGTNAGMVHAINGTLTDTDAGKEVFAYIPSAAFDGPTSTPSTNGLAHVGNPDFKHRFLVDATPLSADVNLGRTAGSTGTDWRTLLVGGMGKGGKALYALDITKPSTITDKAEGVARENEAATKVLWEFTDPDLGYTYGQPVVVKTRKHGWVVVAGSGYNNRDGKGYFFFINPRTGARLEKIEAPCSACSSTNQAGLAHVNAFILDASDGTADTIYAGDLMGNVWRLDVSGTAAYPEPVKFATLTGSDDKVLPITSKPLPVVQPVTNRRYITVGTGRLLDPSDLNSSQAQRFFAILDGTNAAFSNDGTVPGKPSDLPTGVTFPLTVAKMRQLTDLNAEITLDLRTEVGWYLDLGVSEGGPGWRVLSDPSSYYGIVAFAATAPSSGDACSPNGNSRVYALNLGSGKCALEGGRSSCYASPPDGVIVDVQIIADPPNGDTQKTRVVFGDDKGRVGANALIPPTNLGLQRLNWREILVNN